MPWGSRPRRSSSGAPACSQDPNSVAAQAKAGDQKGYVSGDGAVETHPGGEARHAGRAHGNAARRLRRGMPHSPAARCSCINVWGSWCAPCVAEAPCLQKTWAELQADKAPVEFMGIDFREDPARGAAFAKKAGVTYPSLSDESGVSILALQGKAPTAPTTLVLDTEGRIAARVSGATSASTLRGLVDDVVAES